MWAHTLLMRNSSLLVCDYKVILDVPVYCICLLWYWNRFTFSILSCGRESALCLRYYKPSVLDSFFLPHLTYLPSLLPQLPPAVCHESWAIVDPRNWIPYPKAMTAWKIRGKGESEVVVLIPLQGVPGDFSPWHEDTDYIRQPHPSSGECPLHSPLQDWGRWLLPSYMTLGYCPIPCGSLHPAKSL